MTKIDSKIRKNVYERDNFICQICLEKVILTKDIRTDQDYKLEASLDHIKPLSKGGKSVEENLRTICRSCNSVKGNREDPTEIKFLSLNKGEFTRIANAIVNALARTKLNSEEGRVLFAIIGKTYGYQKAEDWVSNSQLEEITKIHRSHCSRTVTRLKNRNIVTKIGNKIKLNKYFFQWVDLLPKQATVTKTGNKKKIPKQATNVARTGTEVLPKQAYTKETIKEKKETIINATNVAGVIKKITKAKKNYEDPKPVSLTEFIEKMRESPQRHMQILGEYADEIKPNYTTKGQWLRFIDRHVRSARALIGYTEDQIETAFERLKKNIKSEQNPKGYITKWTLATLEKYLD